MNQRRTFTTRVERVRLAASWSSDVQTRYWREDVCFMLHCWCGSLKQKTGWKVCKTPILSILPLKNTQGKWATSHARFCIFFYLLSWLFAEREFHIHTQGTRVAANVKSRLFCTRRLLLVTRLAVRLFLHLFFCDTENSSAATCVRIRPVLCKQKEKKKQMAKQYWAMFSMHRKSHECIDVLRCNGCGAATWIPSHVLHTDSGIQRPILLQFLCWKGRKIKLFLQFTSICTFLLIFTSFFFYCKRSTLNALIKLIWNIHFANIHVFHC